MKQILMAFAILLSTISMSAQDNEWLVQIAVYNKQVPANHFHNIKDQIFYSQDAYDFHRYFVGKFSETEATAQSKALSDLGYSTTMMHENDFDARCTCYKTPKPKALIPSLRSIFFDFDKYSLRSESKQQLKLLVKTLKENPTFTTRIQAHTDAKGSNSYNDKLSEKRALAAKKYLISKGIPSHQIFIETFGEVQPIAKNELSNGRDTAEGRQFNRRVELEILNENRESINLVEEIKVPEGLAVN